MMCHARIMRPHLIDCVTSNLTEKIKMEELNILLPVMLRLRIFSFSQREQEGIRLS